MRLQKLWKDVKFEWQVFWLKREYTRRLNEVRDNRFDYDKRGLMVSARGEIHEWYDQEYMKLCMEYYS